MNNPHIADFLFLAPREFVVAAYQEICGRTATAEELDQELRELAEGGDRLLFLHGLRSTEEGRRNGAAVRGLGTYVIAARLSGIPLIGRPLAVLARQLALPSVAVARSASDSFAKRFADFADQLEGLHSRVASLHAALAREAAGDHGVDSYYVSFEDRHRGSRDEIKQRLSVYLPLLDADSIRTLDAPALDLGCGRGEWLELLREQGVAARGIDSNTVMIDRCRSAGLDVVEAEVKPYLACLPEASFSVVSGFHIVEHLPFAEVLSLLDQALRVLKPGGMLILETPNPENVIVGSCNFYFDPTHRNPVPPEALRFAVCSRGFERDEILRLHPPEPLPGESWEGVPARVANAFQVGQDYAVIARKPGNVNIPERAT